VNLVDELHAIADALSGAGIEYAVCGGIAVTVHGATRTTKDIDLLVERSDLPRILELIRPLGYAFVALPMTFDAGTERERHVQRVSKMEAQHHLIVDLMIAEQGFAGLLADRVSFDLPRGRLSVVSRSTLLRMKRLAGRPQDLADIERLEQGDA
jgi:Uncharacterised nucleotidyltransferase